MAASDFTNMRVESNSFDSVLLRYSYGGAGTVTVWRSTDNITFTKIQTIPAAYGSYPTVDDMTVAAATLYYYKLSDDNGSTFNTAVSVQTQVQFPPLDTESKALTLPTFTGDSDVDAANLDHMRSQLEAYINGDYGGSVRKNCQVCPVNGALVLDCATGCYTFTVRQEDITDINSISINCDQLQVVFNIPEGTATEICGWDRAAGLGGDECFQAPISSSTNMPLNMIPPQPCPEVHTLMVPSPCKSDYVYECYDKNSLFRSTRRNLSVIDCSCATIGDGVKSQSTSGLAWTVLSGKNTGLSTLDHDMFAGISIYYKSRTTSCSGVPGAAKLLEYIIGGFTSDSFTWKISGAPIFGFAVNVPQGVTLHSFTGHVFLFDYPNSRYLWGSYSGADLHLGVMPTTISTIAMSTITPTQILISIDTTANHADDVVIEDGSNQQIMPYSGISLITEPIGCGIIWVGNNATGNHTAELTIPKEQDIVWW